MDNHRAKRQELRRFIPDLQCHKCKDLPGPKENEKNRYFCVDSSHTLCEKDKFKCPCGSLVGKNPSPIIAKLLQDLPWMCQNYKRGCREIKMTISGLEFHQRRIWWAWEKTYCQKKTSFHEIKNRSSLVNNKEAWTNLELYFDSKRKITYVHHSSREVNRDFFSSNHKVQKKLK